MCCLPYREGSEMKTESKEGNVAKHTPGPWLVVVGADNDGETENVYASIRNVPCEAQPSSYHLARIWADSQNPEANASLIAAAPEMLAALKAIKKLLDRDGDYSFTTKDGSGMCLADQMIVGQACEQADAAIRKAEGE